MAELWTADPSIGTLLSGRLGRVQGFFQPPGRTFHSRTLSCLADSEDRSRDWTGARATAQRDGKFGGLVVH